MLFICAVSSATVECSQDCCVVFVYHCAIDGKRSVVKLTDSIAYLDIDALFAPLDGGQRVSSHLTVKYGIPSQRLNAI